MTEKQYQKIIESLLDKIDKLEADIFVKDTEIEKLNDLLTPTPNKGEYYE